jgi:hypothetical protein
MEKKPMQIDQVLKAYAAVNVRSITLERQLLGRFVRLLGVESSRQ